MKKNVKKIICKSRDSIKLSESEEIVTSGTILPVNGDGTKKRLCKVYNYDKIELDKLFKENRLIDTHFYPTIIKDDKKNDFGLACEFAVSIYKCIIVQQYNFETIFKIGNKRVLVYNIEKSSFKLNYNNKYTSVTTFDYNDIVKTIIHYLKLIRFSEETIKKAINNKSNVFKKYKTDSLKLSKNYNSWYIRSWINQKGFINSFITGTPSIKENIKVYEYGIKSYIYNEVNSYDGEFKLIIPHDLRCMLQVVFNSNTSTWKNNIVPILTDFFTDSGTIDEQPIAKSTNRKDYTNLDDLYKVLKSTKSRNNLDLTNYVDTTVMSLTNELKELIKFYKSISYMYYSF